MYLLSVPLTPGVGLCSGRAKLTEMWASLGRDGGARVATELLCGERGGGRHGTDQAGRSPEGLAFRGRHILSFLYGSRNPRAAFKF